MSVPHKSKPKRLLSPRTAAGQRAVVFRECALFMRASGFKRTRRLPAYIQDSRAARWKRRNIVWKELRRRGARVQGCYNPRVDFDELRPRVLRSVLKLGLVLFGA